MPADAFGPVVGRFGEVQPRCPRLGGLVEASFESAGAEVDERGFGSIPVHLLVGRHARGIGHGVAELVSMHVSDRERVATTVRCSEYAPLASIVGDAE